jgi:hypothetical protein
VQVALPQGQGSVGCFERPRFTPLRDRRRVRLDLATMLTACGERSPTSTPSDTKGGVRAGGLTANGVAHVGQDDPGGADAGGEGAGTDPADVCALVPACRYCATARLQSRMDACSQVTSDSTFQR